MNISRGKIKKLRRSKSQSRKKVPKNKWVIFIVIKKRFHKFEIQVMIKKNKIPLSFKKIGYTDVKPDDYHNYECVLEYKCLSISYRIIMYKSVNAFDSSCRILFNKIPQCNLFVINHSTTNHFILPFRFCLL